MSWKTKKNARRRLLKTNTTSCKSVFKSGKGGEKMDRRFDEAAWEERVKSSPKRAQYKDPANAFPYYEQKNDLFNGKPCHPAGGGCYRHGRLG